MNLTVRELKLLRQLASRTQRIWALLAVIFIFIVLATYGCLQMGVYIQTINLPDLDPSIVGLVKALCWGFMSTFLCFFALTVIPFFFLLPNEYLLLRLYEQVLELERHIAEPADASNHSPRVTPAADAPVAPRSDGR